MALANNDLDTKNNIEEVTINQPGVFGKKIVASVFKQNDHETLDDTANHYDSSEIIKKICQSYQLKRKNVLKILINCLEIKLIKLMRILKMKLVES